MYGTYTHERLFHNEPLHEVGICSRSGAHEHASTHEFNRYRGVRPVCTENLHFYDDRQVPTAVSFRGTWTGKKKWFSFIYKNKTVLLRLYYNERESVVRERT